MQQLTGLDTAFLNIETSTTYGHVSGLAIYEPHPDPDVDPFENLRTLFLERIHLIPLCRRRLVEVPFGIDQPYWIEDPDFDIDFHIRHLGLPPPGSSTQLADQVARIVARPLDRRRPLWELYVIEGLEGGYVAHLTKIHHCAIDGVAGAEILMNLLDIEPERRVVEAPDKDWKPEPQPTDLEMLGRGLASVATRPLKGLQLWYDTLNNLSAVTRSVNVEIPGAALMRRLQGIDPEMLSRAATKPPRTSFNQKIGPHRRFAFTSLELADIKLVKDTFGLTVNDVVMAVCAGALRSYLSDRHELPETPLISMVPVSVRDKSQQGAGGNRVAAMTASLHTDEPDPVERLHKIHTSMMIAKDTHNALPATLQQDLAEFSPPAVAGRAARLALRAANAHLVDVPYNVVISNIPGPQFPLYGAGAALVANYPVSTIHDGAGLNFTVQSYDGKLDVGVVGCRELVPGVWDLIDRLEAATAELKAAALAELEVREATTKKKTASKRSSKPKKADAKKPSAKRAGTQTKSTKKAASNNGSGT